MNGVGWPGVGRRAGVVLVVLGLLSTIGGSVLAAPRPPSSAGGGDYVTPVASDITTDTTWRAADSPYRISGQLWVRGGATLSIEPGVAVEFDEQGELLVEGALIAEGTADGPITFDRTDPQAGSWFGIVLLGTADTPTDLRLAHATVAHATGRETAQIHVTNGRLEATDSAIRDGGDGGIRVESGALVLSRTQVTGNQGTAIHIRRVSNEPPSADPRFDDVTISGNGVDAVVLNGGYVTADSTWEDAGAPYRLDFQLFVEPLATLTIEPGVEVRGREAGQIVVGGSLVAHGTADQPIRLVGDRDIPAAWRGILVRGSAEIAAEVSLRHVTLGNAGVEVLPAVDVFNGRFTFSDGTIAGHAGDGVVFTGGNVAGVIENSTITDIGGAGVVNSTQTLIVAPNNWWGSATGPTASDECGTGQGTRVEGLVRVSPWLRSGDQRPDPLIAADIPTLTLVPQRWFAPADGQTPVWVDAYLRDAQGAPIPGATVVLGSTLGSVTSSGITDAAGHTLAFLTSTTTGDAELSASLANSDPCRQPESTVARVTFTAAGDGLLAGMQAPYLFNGIDVDPEPVTAGVPTTISARITNPNAEPIRVEAFFAFVQASIGLAFGPLGEPQTKEIPANGEASFAITWTPSVSGHYCVEVRYRVVEGPGAAVPGPVAAVGGGLEAPWPSLYQVDGGGGGGGGGGGAGGGGGQRNLQVYGGPGGSGSRDSHEILRKADKAGKVVGLLGRGPFGIPKFLVGKLTGWAFDTTATSVGALQGDPPRLDYDLIATPDRRPLPAQERPADVSEARWAAELALDQALAEATAVGDAAIVSLDRYGGAGNADDLEWASVQMASLIHYRKQFGQALVDVAAKVAALRAVLERELPDGGQISVDQVRAAQAALATNGYLADEVAAARAVGLTDDQIDAVRQQTLGWPPEELAGRFVDRLAEAEAALGQAGTALLEPVNFVSEPGREAYYGGQLLAAIVGGSGEQSNLARVYDHTSTIDVGNPLDHAAVVELRARPISIPSEWIVEISPSSIALEPGEQATVTVNITATTPVAQGMRAQLAVEGYAEGNLLGGVVVAVLVPKYMAFGATGGDQTQLLLVLGAVVAVLAAAALVGVLLYRRRRREREQAVVR